MSEVKTEKLSPRVTSLQLGDSGDTFTVPSGATLDIASGATIDATGATITGWPAAVDNTPSFCGKLSSDTSITSATWTKLAFDAEDWDSDGAFDTTTNPGRFTVPSGEGGNYVFHGGAGGFTGGSGYELMYLSIYKNGSSQTNGGRGHQWMAVPSGGTGWDVYSQLTATMPLVAGDYVELYVYQNLSTSDTVAGLTYFSGFKLAGV